MSFLSITSQTFLTMTILLSLILMFLFRFYIRIAQRYADLLLVRRFLWRNGPVARLHRCRSANFEAVSVVSLEKSKKVRTGMMGIQEWRWEVGGFTATARDLQCVLLLCEPTTDLSLVLSQMSLVTCIVQHTAWIVKHLCTLTLATPAF